MNNNKNIMREQCSFQSCIEGFHVRFATVEDCPLILSFIQALGNFERRSACVVATVEDLVENIFQNRYAEVLIAEYQGKSIGFALYFHTFSTFLGKPGVYIEDVYIQDSMRGKGFGREIFRFLAKLAIHRKCGRIEWCCLHWNRNALDFYASLGAESKDEWVTLKLEGEQIKNILK